MRLIPNWRRAWRMLSVQVAAAAVAWVALPAPAQEQILRVAGLSEQQLPAVLGLLVIVARLIAQPGVSGDDGR